MKIKLALLVTALAVALLSGCTITPPPVSTAPDDPSNPNAAESSDRPMRPMLMEGAPASLEKGNQ